MVRIIMAIDEPIPLMCGPGKSRFQHDGHWFRPQGPKNADAHNFLMTADDELSMRSSSWNVTDSNKPILHLINRDPSFYIYGMAELYMYMQEILEIYRIL